MTPPQMTTPVSSQSSSPLRGDERALSESTKLHYIENEKEYRYKPPGFKIATHIEDIVDLTRDLLALKPAQCAPGRLPVQSRSTLLDKRLQLANRLTPDQLQEHFPKHRLHPYVDLFLHCAAKERLFDWNRIARSLSEAERIEYAAARQRMLVAMHARAREPAFHKKVKAHQDKARRNLTCIRRYTDGQFARHSRLLVIRVDCMFVDGFAPAHDWIQARAYRETLIKFLNRDLPGLIQSQKDRDAKKKTKPIAGYIISTEYGVETGWHFHVTLFLNGDDHQSDVGIASLICLRWMDDITGGDGRYYNCNHAARQGLYGNKVGIGMVHRRDLFKREILNKVVIRYGAKGCYYAEAQTGTKDRLLNKGGWPKEKDLKKGGRPEKPVQVQRGLLTHVFSEKKKRFFPIWTSCEPSQPRLGY